MTNRFVPVIGCVLVLGLTGCTYEPSEADIKAVIQTKYDAMNNLGNLFGMKHVAELAAVEKIGCQSIREKVYRCDVIVTGTGTLSGPEKTPMSMVLMRGKTGWSALDE